MNLSANFIGFRSCLHVAFYKTCTKVWFSWHFFLILFDKEYLFEDVGDKKKSKNKLFVPKPNSKLPCEPSFI